ncbi:MAG: DUF992 domain-containing protein [Methyloligellaceae bacterium]
MLRFKFLTMLVLALSFGMISTFSAQANRIEIGTMTCRVEGSSGFIFGSSRKLKCTYNPLGSSPRELYEGAIKEYGIDFGITGKTVFVWVVLAGNRNLPEGAFNGKYTGVSAKASVGAGLGLKLLVGGSDDTIALQPVSVQAQTGVNIALAVQRLTLKSVGFEDQKTTEVKATPEEEAHKMCGTTVYYAPGDSLGNIASRCGTTVDALLETNPSIKNIKEIKIGEKIIVPNYPLPSAGSRCGLNVVAEEGDTYRKIAQRCQVSLGALVNENPKRQFNVPIRAGDKISIPAYPTPLARRSCGESVRLSGKGTHFSTLDDIAEICGTTVDGLLNVNPEIKNVRFIKKGQKIKIPQIAMPVVQNICGSHTIARKGETIYTIAFRCKTTPGAIIDLNERLGELDQIPEGQTIRIARSTIPMKQK